MARPDHEGSGPLPQFVVGVKPPEDDALEYVVHGLNEGISNPHERRDRPESNLFAAVVIHVIVAALVKVVTDLLSAALGEVSGGEWIARGAGMAILVIGIFAALGQLQIAPVIVNGLFYALLAIIVGVAIVAFGGGGIQTARRYWERASDGVERKASEIRRDAERAAAVDRARDVVGVPELEEELPDPPRA